ncbi:MAG: hypothetical protein ACR2I0_05975 [Rhodoferax sp.]
MTSTRTTRTLAALIAGCLLSFASVSPALAQGGVKCRWVVISYDPQTGVSILNRVCVRGA